MNVVAMERAEAAYTVLEDNENFATADLQAQFVRGAKVGFLKHAGGWFDGRDNLDPRSGRLRSLPHLGAGLIASHVDA